MTPMIDVVFLLIIFFLVSSHLAHQEHRVDVELPIAAEGNPDLPDDSVRITLNVTKDGTIFVGRRAIDTGELAAMLKRVVKDRPTQVEVRIRSDRLATYDQIMPIMKAAVDANIWDVTFAVRNEIN